MFQLRCWKLSAIMAVLISRQLKPSTSGKVILWNLKTIAINRIPSKIAVLRLR